MFGDMHLQRGRVRQPDEVEFSHLDKVDLAAATERVEKQDDLEVLSRWFDLSLTLSPEKILDELKG